MSRLLTIALVAGLSAAPLSAEVFVRPSTAGRPEITNVGPGAGTRTRSQTRSQTPLVRESAPSRRSAAIVPATRRLSRVELADTIRAAAGRNAVDPALIEAMIEAESAWDARAVSRTGAQGLMQIMPATARDLALTRPFDPIENVRAGTAYLRQMLDQFEGRVALALAAYNAGPSTVMAYGGVPPYPETVAYVRRVLGLWLGDAAPAVVPASRRLPGAVHSASPTRPVRWSRDGKRPHLTNVK